MNAHQRQHRREDCSKKLEEGESGRGGNSADQARRFCSTLSIFDLGLGLSLSALGLSFHLSKMGRPEQKNSVPLPCTTPTCVTRLFSKTQLPDSILHHKHNLESLILPDMSLNCAPGNAKHQ